MIRIAKPIERDGIWVITVHRDDGDEDVRFPDRKAAMAGELALRRALSLLLPRAACDPGSVRGPHYERDRKRWKLRWRVDGEEKAFVRESKAEVLAKKAELLNAKGGKPHLAELPNNFEGDAPQIKRALVDAIFAINAAARNGDDDQLVRLRKYVAALSEASHAIVPHTQYAKLKAEFDALIAFHEGMQRGKAQGAPVGAGDAGQPPVDRRINSTLADRPRPAPPVH